jgi:hypothetical protein
MGVVLELSVFDKTRRQLRRQFGVDEAVECGKCAFGAPNVEEGRGEEDGRDLGSK